MKIEKPATIKFEIGFENYSLSEFIADFPEYNYPHIVDHSTAEFNTYITLKFSNRKLANRYIKKYLSFDHVEFL